jgi:hypothetical protein
MKSLAECVHKYPMIDKIPHEVCQDCTLRKNTKGDNICTWGNEHLRKAGFDL